MTWHHPENLVKSRDLVRILWADLYFKDHLFLVFYISFWFTFSGFISDVKIDNAAKFQKSACVEIAFLKIGIYGILISQKNFMVIPFGFSKFTGVVEPPTIRCH